MNTSVAKKASRAVRLLMMVLTAVLIFFFINVMLLVSDIQGTARVVNYAGLVPVSYTHLRAQRPY